MPLVISTTNTTGLALSAIIDKVTQDGVLVDPAERWNIDTEDWDDPAGMSAEEWSYTLSEGLDGYYEGVIEGIDSSAENLRILIQDEESALVIGSTISIPIPLTAPEVTIDLTVTEDRN